MPRIDASLRRAALAMVACALLLAPGARAQDAAVPGAVVPGGAVASPHARTPGHPAPSQAQPQAVVGGPAPAAPTTAGPVPPQPAPAGSHPPPAAAVAPVGASEAAPGPAPADNTVADTIGALAGETKAPAPPASRSPSASADAVGRVTAAAIAADRTQLQAIAGAVGRLQAEDAKAGAGQGQTQVRQDAATAQASADAFARARLAEVTAFDQELRRFQTSSGRPRARLSAAEQRERADLSGRRAQVLGLARGAEQAASTASGVYNAVANRRRSDFASKVFERTASPLEAEFWSSLAAALGTDLHRLGGLLQDTAATALDAPEPRGMVCVIVALALAFILLVPAQQTARRLIRRRAARTDAEATEASAGEPSAATLQRQASGDLGRSAHALAAVLIETILPGMAAVAVNLGLTWGELVSDRTEALAQSGVRAVFWGAAVVALSHQLAGAPEERLLPVSERLSARMRALPWLVALITGAGFLLRRINIVVGASLAATIAANCLVALAYAGVASLVLLALGGDQGAGGGDAGGGDADGADVRQPGRVLLSLALSTAIVVTVGAVLAGFSTFAALVSSQIFWISVLAAVAYVLSRFADDVVARLFAPRGWLGRLLTVVLNLRQSTVGQLGVLTSAVVQVLIVLAAISLGLTPFGSNGDLLDSHLARFGQAVHVGSITISPGSVLAGLASLVVGLGLVHLVERWVDRRYLPVTDWDAGVRNSVSTGVRYLGVGLAILWALAAAGLGFKQIALVASALSVGIGFGLQQIVQNFVSGLILLVERPVKVGDWVNLGGVEGDVQRIRVRSTEIRTFDRTTLIVPNSDLITKQVQNKTLGDPRGRVRLEVSVGAPADAARARDALLKMREGDEAVLDDPKPLVVIDSLTPGGSVNYVLFAYVDSQRDVMRTRSRLYEAVLELFGREKIGFVGGPAVNIMEPGPEMRSFVDDLAGRLKTAPGPADPPPPSPPPPPPTQG